MLPPSTLEEWRARAESLEEEVVQLRKRVFGTNMVVPLCWRLTPLEGKMLRVLASHVQCHRELILDAFRDARWDWEAEPKIVDTIMCKMRGKLRPYGVVVDTVCGIGYSMQPESRAYAMECMLGTRDARVPLGGTEPIQPPVTPLYRRPPTKDSLYSKIMSVLRKHPEPLSTKQMYAILVRDYAYQARTTQPIRNLMPDLVLEGVVRRVASVPTRKPGPPHHMYILPPLAPGALSHD